MHICGILGNNRTKLENNGNTFREVRNRITGKILSIIASSLMKGGVQTSSGKED